MMPTLILLTAKPTIDKLRRCPEAVGAVPRWDSNFGVTTKARALAIINAQAITCLRFIVGVIVDERVRSSCSE